MLSRRGPGQGLSISLFFPLVFLLLATLACGTFGGNVAPTVAPTAEPVVDGGAAGPTPTLQLSFTPDGGNTPVPEPNPEAALPPDCRVSGTSVFISPEGDYCLAYPTTFVTETLPGGQMAFYGPPLEEGPEPLRASLLVETVPVLDELTLDELVDGIIAELEIGDRPLARTTAALGGEPAVRLEVVPGREGSRDLFVLHDGILYRLLFMPSVADFPQAADQVETLYNLVTESFSFLPREVPRG